MCDYDFLIIPTGHRVQVERTIPEKINWTKQRNQAKMERAKKFWYLFLPNF